MTAKGTQGKGKHDYADGAKPVRLPSASLDLRKDTQSVYVKAWCYVCARRGKGPYHRYSGCTG